MSTPHSSLDNAVTVGAGRVGLGLSRRQQALKRSFDFLGAAAGLLATFWLIALAWLLGTLDTRQNGFFIQDRVGQHGRRFRVVKIRTMRPSAEVTTTVTTGRDPRITPVGRFLRRTKIDELPSSSTCCWVR